MPWDNKYGEITVARLPGTPFGDDEPVILFRARDITTPALLTVYRTLCTGRDCDPNHIAAIDNAVARFKAWQLANPGSVKTPD